MRIDRFDVCGKSENATLSIEYLEIQHVRRGSFVACKFILRKRYNKIGVCRVKKLLDTVKTL